jgi:lincosamide nucleotidyltransferase
MIEGLRRLCQADERVSAAMLYGSFAYGEADSHSDIESLFFFDPAVLPTLDKSGWISQIAPVLLFFQDDFGHHTAIFKNLVRGEFHFLPVDQLAIVASWKGTVWFPSLEATVLVDRTGELSRQLQSVVGSAPERDTPEAAAQLIAMFCNVMLFGLNTLDRGELARALDLLSLLHRYVLWMARLVENSTVHWLTPARRLEDDLSPQAYKRYAECSAHLDQHDLYRAYRATWTWGLELAKLLCKRHSLVFPADLFDTLAKRVGM